VVTKTGCEIITRFPAEELLVAGHRYHTATGPLPTTREIQSHLNRRGDERPMETVVAGAGNEGSRGRA
jgi:hypothetical protein